MKISKKQNIITNRGNKYKFVKSKDPCRMACKDCAFKRNSVKFCLSVPCIPKDRDDIKKGYFVKVTAPTKKASV